MRAGTRGRIFKAYRKKNRKRYVCISPWLNSYLDPVRCLALNGAVYAAWRCLALNGTVYAA